MVSRWGFGGTEKVTFSLYIIVGSVNFVIFVFGELASPTVAQSWACRTARRVHNRDGRFWVSCDSDSESSKGLFS